jgi:hypothetical protein
VPYLKLFHGRRRSDASLEDEARPGPIFGPSPYFIAVGGTEIHFDHDSCVLEMVGDLVYYDGVLYSDWSIFDGLPSEEDQHHLTTFDAAKALVPEAYQPCQCMQPGFFNCGVPGVLAHLQNGRLPPDGNVQHCNQCGQYPDDESARQKLVELGLAWTPDRSVTRYSVHCYATVRVEFDGVIASTPQDAARIIDALFDWDEHQHLAEYAEELTEFLVDVEGDADRSRSRRFNWDFEPVET